MKHPYQVLIADDEPIIREGIFESIDWRSLGMEVMGLAEDGAEALEMTEQQVPDIILVDMNMPIMDGITLIQSLRENNLDSRCVIITGYDEFGYAQKAIGLGVDEYILKPVDPATLEKVLRRIKLSLDEKQKQRLEQEAASEHVKKKREILREQLGQEWIQGRLSEGEIISQLHLLALPPAHPVSLLVIRWPEMPTTKVLLTERDRKLYMYAVKNITEELLGSDSALIFKYTDDLIVGITWIQITPELLMKIEDAAKGSLGITVHTAYENAEGPLIDISQAYQRIKDNIYQEASVSPLVRRARHYLQEHFHDPALTLELAASELSVSPVYLSRMLKKEVGDSFISLLTGIRIRKAIQLLNGTELSIHEIAEQIGYESQHYFSTAFKKVIGISPNKYRKGEAFQNE
ncbi:response regulator [Paenibacillus polygoni]|uniref:Response regulator n=1 Tax=Paenibacillus polygoni TaxID=3050112 RepID=A0ABY8X4B9_9BACL|nr:response regulator [Paenibacillus polygoni]WIV20370.1 response regulator [Paenibacillus polygoni]